MALNPKCIRTRLMSNVVTNMGAMNPPVSFYSAKYGEPPSIETYIEEKEDKHSWPHGVRNVSIETFMFL